MRSQHLRGGVDRGQLGCVIRECGGPLAGAARELEHPPPAVRCEYPQGIHQRRSRRVIRGNRTGRVVLGSARTVIGRLLGP